MSLSISVFATASAAWASTLHHRSARVRSLVFLVIYAILLVGILCNLFGGWPPTAEAVVTGALGFYLCSLAFVSSQGILDVVPQDEAAGVSAMLGTGMVYGLLFCNFLFVPDNSRLISCLTWLFL